MGHARVAQNRARLLPRVPSEDVVDIPVAILVLAVQAFLRVSPQGVSEAWELVGSRVVYGDDDTLAGDTFLFPNLVGLDLLQVPGDLKPFGREGLT